MSRPVRTLSAFILALFLGAAGSVSGAAVGLQNSALADTAPPVLESASFSPARVNVTTIARQVVITARITDATAANPPSVYALSDTTTQYALASMQLVSGTTQDGTYRATITIPAGSAPGRWTVMIGSLTDSAQNSDQTNHPFPTKLTVVNASAPSAPAEVTSVAGGVQPTRS